MDGTGILEVQTLLPLPTRARQAKEPTVKIPQPVARLSLASALLESDRLPRISHTMAQAILFEDLLAQGEATDHADLARLGAISRERVSQVMKMLWLGPDIQDDILRLPPVRRGDFSIMVPEVTAITDEVLWEDQRILWSNLKQKKKLGEPADVG